MNVLLQVNIVEWISVVMMKVSNGHFYKLLLSFCFIITLGRVFKYSLCAEVVLYFIVGISSMVGPCLFHEQCGYHLTNWDGGGW